MWMAGIGCTLSHNHATHAAAVQMCQLCGFTHWWKPGQCLLRNCKAMNCSMENLANATSRGGRHSLLSLHSDHSKVERGFTVNYVPKRILEESSLYVQFLQTYWYAQCVPCVDAFSLSVAFLYVACLRSFVSQLWKWWLDQNECHSMSILVTLFRNLILPHAMFFSKYFPGLL